MIQIKTFHHITLLSILLFFSSFGISRAQEKAREKYGNETEKLALHPAIKKSFQYILDTDEALIDELIRLTEIPAPPFQEKERGKAYRKLLKEAGADEISTDEVGNIIAIRKGAEKGKAIVLSAHLDTVFPEGTDVRVKRKGARLYAPGISDDTRGLICVLNVLRAMNHAKIRTKSDVWFVASVGEEGLGDLRGVKHLFKQHADQIRSFITIDGNGNEGIVNQAVGSKRYRIIFTGPGGHSWGAFGTVNPAHAQGKAIALFTERAAAFTETGEKTSYNIGKIGGGTSINSVPFETWMEVDMRSINPDRLKKIDAILRRSVEEAVLISNQDRKRGEELTVELKPVGDRPSGVTAKNSSLVQRAIASAAHFGVQSQLRASSTDANLPISLGIPGICIGSGGTGGGAHSLDEWWENKNGYIGIQRALLLTVAEAELAD